MVLERKNGLDWYAMLNPTSKNRGHCPSIATFKPLEIITGAGFFAALMIPMVKWSTQVHCHNVQKILVEDSNWIERLFAQL